MSESDELLEEKFETLLMQHGAPVCKAHVLAETSGFLLDGEGLPQSHADSMMALGIVTSGLIAARSGDDQDSVMIDKDRNYLLTFYIDTNAAKLLMADLAKLVAEMEN